MQILSLLVIPFSVLLLLASCASPPADPLRALPAQAGLTVYWQPAAAVPLTGFADLDATIRRLASAVPVRDSLAGAPYAAFAYNLRPGELGAGLAVATEAILVPKLTQTDIEYRGFPIFRIDSAQLLYTTYETLSLVAPEAVIIQEMIDQLLDGATVDLPAGMARSDVQVLRYTLPELSALFSSQTSERSRTELAQWAATWQTLSLQLRNDTLLAWHLTPVSSPPATSALNCLPSIPAGIEHFTLLPVPAAGPANDFSANWSTYFAPWLGPSYARISTNDGNIIGFCPDDVRLMQDLLDRLEREFAVAERINYPNGTILRTEAPGLTTTLLAPLPTETWLLRTKEQTYLASNAVALEKMLDLQLLAGPQSLPAAIRQTTPNPVIVARLNAERLTRRMNTLFSGWTPPPWWSGLAGWWSGTAEARGIVLQSHAVADSDSWSATQPSTTGIAWRWEAPAAIESIYPIPGTARCAVYLQDGALVVLNERQQEQVRTRLGAPPNSPVYQLPATPDHSIRWLFSTPTAVHLIDTAGQAVAGFPYRPAGGLAAGLTLDALDRASDPAYFVPLRTGRIEAYSLRGLPLFNWTVPTDFCATAPLITLYSDTSTYLAGVDTLSRVRVYDRQGSVALTFDSLPTPLISAVAGQLAPGMGPGRLAALELDGRVRVMSLAGGHFPLRVTLPNGAPRQLLFTDLWGDRRKDYLVGRSGTVALYAYEKQAFAQRWQAQIPGSVDHVFALPALQLVGGLDRGRGLIYLLEGKEGRLLDERGLAGRLPGQELVAPDGSALMVTAYNRTLYAYRIVAAPPS